VAILKRSKGRVPDEFSFFDERQWLAFNAHVQRILRTRQVRIVAPGLLAIGDPPAQVGLLNIAQICHARHRNEWGHLIREHFATVLEFNNEIDADKLASQLRVRLLPDDVVGPLAADSMVQPFTESVVAMMVADLPSAIRGITATDLDRSTIPVDVAWELAWENTHRFEQVEATIEILGGVAYHSVLDASFYTASKVRWLPEVIGDIPEAGALVVIPRRHSIVAHKLIHMQALTAVHQLIDTARQLFLDGPGSVSRHLYWWHDGQLIWLPAYYDERRIEFHPPTEFTQALGGLPG
jgi:hypothetical protein